MADARSIENYLNVRDIKSSYRKENLISPVHQHRRRTLAQAVREIGPLAIKCDPLAFDLRCQDSFRKPIIKTSLNCNKQPSSMNPERPLKLVVAKGLP